MRRNYQRGIAWCIDMALELTMRGWGCAPRSKTVPGVPWKR